MPNQPKPKVSISVPTRDEPRESDSETAPLNKNRNPSQASAAFGRLEQSVSLGESFAGSPLAPRVTKGRRSFAAALWNPMTDSERREFNQKRFLQLVIGIFMGVMVGVQYAFGVVSNSLKQKASFRQSDMTTITTVGNCLFAFTFPAGVLFDYAGPKPVLICAMLFGCTGFTLLALIFGGVIEPTVATVSIANGLPSWQAGFLESGTLLPSLFMFPSNKGEVVILQKTFFGLGSTFLSLSYDGFFSDSEDYMGYCIYVTCLIFLAISAGIIVTRLPAYRRTTRELDAIKRMRPEDAERAKQMEELSFEMHHNPRLCDRRRLNFGVTMLLVTLVFFTTLSFIKAEIHIDTHVVMALTFLALACIGSFGVMLLPIQLPAFFDYEFLPDIHAPEELVNEEEPPKTSAAREKRTVTGPAVPLGSPLNTGSPNEVGSPSSVNPRQVGSTNMTDSVATGLTNAESMTEDPRALGDSPSLSLGGGREGALSASGAFDGRASFFLEKRASVAGGSMIAIPKAVNPMAIPSISTPFLASLRHPFIWCFWFGAFAIMGSNFVFVNNVTQIYVALNNGVFVKSSNSLNVALIGIGSAIGRICAGFGETYLHRVNAIHRDRQLEYLAKQELNLLTGEDPAVDMTPVYHRWNASIVMVLPLAPIVVGAMCLLTLVVPAAALSVVFPVFACAVGLFLGLMALSVREIFSVDVAKHLNFILSAGMIATILLNRVMFGMWYDAEFDRQSGHSGNDDLVVGAVILNTNFRVGDRSSSVDDALANSIASVPVAQMGFFIGDSSNASSSVITTSAFIPTTTAPTTTPLPTNGTTIPMATECIGVSCIRNSMLVLAGVNVLGFFAISFVVYHWWQVRKTFV